jgi:phosphatidate cytidylyltransferase
MVRRTVTALLLLALILPAVYLGGLLYFFYVGAFITLAIWEYVQMFQAVKFEPSLAMTVGGTLVILAVRAFWPAGAGAAFAAVILAAMTVHMIAYERGRNEAALDFVISVGGIAYLGWIAAYMIDLRLLPNGAWWALLVFPVVWLADTGAYLIGARYGRHRMLSRLSPKKSWEGYFAGVAGGTLAAGFLAAAYSHFGHLHISFWQGIAFGFVLSTVTTLGDLGESLFKRFANAKDSGNFLPGHGGAFDRIDSLIWAGVIGYFWIRLFML